MKRISVSLLTRASASSKWFTMAPRWIVARMTQPNFRAMAAASQKPQLIVIPYSHFCEVASWALELSGVEHDVHAFSPGEHVLPVLRARLGDGERLISESSSVKNSMRGKDGQRELGGGLRGASTAVPLCILPDGRVLLDSWSVASHFLPGEVSPDFKRELDLDLGPSCRQLAYAPLFARKNRDIWDGLVAPSTSGLLWRSIWTCFGNSLTKNMVKMFKTEDSGALSHCREEIDASFKHLAETLDASPGPYFGGSTVSIADVAVAALAAPVILPEKYCGGRYKEVFEQLGARDLNWTKEVESWRSTRIGQHVLMVYDRHRKWASTK